MNLLKSLRCTLEGVNAQKVIQSNNNNLQSKIKAYVTNKIACMICDKSHYIQCCEIFKYMSPNERFDKVKELRLCFNCLHKGHGTP